MPIIADNARQAWVKYVSTGAIAANLLRTRTREAWERAHELGANPKGMRAEQLSSGEVAELVAHNATLLQISRPYLEALSRAAGVERHAAVLADHRGVVLELFGDEESLYGAERVPGRGAICSEEACGANSVGTPLATGEAAEFIASEHFMAGLQPFTSHGVPLRDADGRTVAVLSTSARTVAASQRLGRVLQCAARGIESELLLQRIHADLARLLASPADPAALQAMQQDLLTVRGRTRQRVDDAATHASGQRTQHVELLVRLAERSAEQLRGRAETWRRLAMGGSESATRVALDQLVAEVLAVAQPDADRAGVELIRGELEPAVIDARAGEVVRRVHRAVVRAVGALGRGGAVRVEVRLWRSRRCAEARISGRLEGAFQELEPVQIYFPLERS